jgi:hypothetical protein
MESLFYQLLVSDKTTYNEDMKILVYLVLIALLVCGSGCMTNATVEKARGPATFDLKDKNGSLVGEHKNSKPGYYLLLPLTVAADIATSPVQIPVLIWAKSVGLDKIN